MPPVNRHYDYIVIGVGAGGLTAAEELRKIGKDVLIVGKDIGGECTHTGCIPSKTFLSLAMHYVMKSQKLCNVELRQGIFDKIRDKVAELEKKEKTRITAHNIPFIRGMAHFVNQDTILVEEERTDKKYKITFNQCVIATGSRPQVVKIEGIPEKKIITNDNLFKLKELPERVVIFGGGPIGTEVGTAFAKFCTHTTIIVRSEMIPHEPRECVEEVKKSLVEEFNAKLYENVKETKYDKETGKLFLYDENKQEIAHVPEAEYYMMALGRLPNVESLHLDKAGVHYEKDGIVVNRNLQTSNPQIFAIGDVLQGPKFKHLASSHARFIMKRAMNPGAQREETPLPACTYSDPPIASVGELEETETTRKFIIDFSKSDRGRVEDAQGLKGVIYVDMPTGFIQGASLVGHFAENAINFFTLAILKKMSVWEFESFMVPYPTIFSGIEDLYDQFVQEYSKNRFEYSSQRIQHIALKVLPLVSLAGIGFFFMLSLL